MMISTYDKTAMHIGSIGYVADKSKMNEFNYYNNTMIDTVQDDIYIITSVNEPFNGRMEAIGLLFQSGIIQQTQFKYLGSVVMDEY